MGDQVPTCRIGIRIRLYGKMLQSPRQVRPIWIVPMNKHLRCALNERSLVGSVVRIAIDESDYPNDPDEQRAVYQNPVQYGDYTLRTSDGVKAQESDRTESIENRPRGRRRERPYLHEQPRRPKQPRECSDNPNREVRDRQCALHDNKMAVRKGRVGVRVLRRVLHVKLGQGRFFQGGHQGTEVRLVAEDQVGVASSSGEAGAVSRDAGNDRSDLAA